MHGPVDGNFFLALVTLTLLEIVLGIDNIIFVAILAGKLPAALQQKARVIGLTLAMFMRIALLFSLTLLMKLTTPIFTVLSNELSGRDLILIAGGLFLLAKSTVEIHDNLEGEKHGADPKLKSTFGGVLGQIVAMDLIFSLDSVITAVGMTSHLGIMIAAIVIAIVLMMVFAQSVGHFIERHPTVKMLALSFLLLIGVSLVSEGLDFHVPKGYIYFAMFFSIFVEMLNVRVHRNRAQTASSGKAAAAE
ncbi:MAG: TerC family protein [Kiritimatiellae bacterium]|nr:TerC family protein [Kiritimatiellia bacterium]